MRYNLLLVRGLNKHLCEFHLDPRVPVYFWLHTFFTHTYSLISNDHIMNFHVASQWRFQTSGNVASLSWLTISIQDNQGARHSQLRNQHAADNATNGYTHCLLLAIFSSKASRKLSKRLNDRTLTWLFFSFGCRPHVFDSHGDVRRSTSPRSSF